MQSKNDSDNYKKRIELKSKPNQVQQLETKILKNEIEIQNFLKEKGNELKVSELKNRNETYNKKLNTLKEILLSQKEKYKITESFSYRFDSRTKRLILYLSLIHISEPTRQAEISYAVFCLKKKTTKTTNK